MSGEFDRSRAAGYDKVGNEQTLAHSLSLTERREPATKLAARSAVPKRAAGLQGLLAGSLGVSEISTTRSSASSSIDWRS